MNVLHLLHSCWDNWNFAVPVAIGLLAIAAASIAAARASEGKTKETKPGQNK